MRITFPYLIFLLIFDLFFRFNLWYVAIILLLTYLFIIYKSKEDLASFLIISPLYPQIFRQLEIPFFNDITIYFVISLLLIGLPKLKKIKKDLILVALIAFISLTSVINGIELKSLIVSFLIQFLILILLIYTLIDNVKALNTFKKYLFTFISFICIDFIFEKIYFGVDKLDGGYLGTGNTYGNILVIVFFLFLLISKLNIINRIFLYSIIGLTLFLSLSRGSQLTFLIGTLFYEFIIIRGSSKNNLRYFLLTIVVVITYFIYSMDTIPIDEIKSFDEISTGRTAIWLRIFEFFAFDPQKLIIGGGYNSFLDWHFNNYGVEINTQNHLLLILCEGGLISLILYITYLFRRFPLNNQILLTISLFGIGFFSHFSVSSTIFYMFLIGQFILSNKIDKDMQNLENNNLV